MRKESWRAASACVFPLLMAFAMVGPEQGHAVVPTPTVVTPGVAADPRFNRRELEKWVAVFERGPEGETGGWVSDYFCDFVLVEPGIFFEVMAAHPAVFDTWVQYLPENSLTDYGSCVDRECFRERLMKRLETIELYKRFDKKRFGPMLKKLLATVKNTRVEHVPM